MVSLNESCPHFLRVLVGGLTPSQDEIGGLRFKGLKRLEKNGLPNTFFEELGFSSWRLSSFDRI